MINKKNILKRLIFSVMVFLIISFFAFISIKLENSNENKDPVTTLKNELSNNEGEYNLKTIILKNVGNDLAVNISKRLNAKLRINKNGDFAKITLEDDRNIMDIVNDESYRDIIQYFSLDYKVDLSDNDVDYDNQINYTPTQPTYSYINDEEYVYQKYLNYLNLNNIWENNKGNGITIAVIDSGVDYDHPDLSGKISELSYNATLDLVVKDNVLENGEYDWSLIDDEYGHGTAVTGVIAAKMNNSIGIVGIAPNVNILTIKAETDAFGYFYTSDLVFGIYYAIEQNVDIINMSFGSNFDYFSEAIKLAKLSDITCVAAAGNDSTASLTYPAADPNVIGVGALAADSYELAEYSNYGDNTNIVAPGTVYTTLKDGSYGEKEGTSFAAPIVSAILALQSYKDGNSFREFKEKTELIYASSSDLGDLGFDFYYGYGLINAGTLVLGERKTVTFNYLTDEIETTKQVFIKNHPLQNIPILERNYQVYNGWYYDSIFSEECNLYVDKWPDDIELYCNWENEDDTIPFTYKVLENGTVEITGYIGRRKYISIPEYIDGMVVSSIGNFAFKNEKELIVVNLPNQLKNIGEEAFSNCIRLSEISIPDSVIKIGTLAFNNNVRLKTIKFGQHSDLRTICNGAFLNCSSLKEFNIPQHVIYNSEKGYMVATTFLGCSNLKNINAHKKSTYFYSDNGVLYSKSKNILILYPQGKKDETYNVFDNTIILGSYSFINSSIKNINFNNIEKIYEYAFYNSNLEAIILPNSVNELGLNAFSMSKLKEVQLSNNLNELSDELFSYTYNLKEILIPRNVNLIGNSCFANSGLEIINFEENSSLRIIGNNSFSNTSIKNIKLPNELEFINSQAFSNTFLSEINIPDNAYFDYKSFINCNYLKVINISKDHKYFTSYDGIVYTKDETTLYFCPPAKEKVTIKSNTLYIGDYSFYQNKNIISLDLPEGLIGINEHAFRECNSLNNINLPGSLKYIGSFAFFGCVSLDAIYLPSDLNFIESSAFSNCDSITRITIPKNIKAIGDNVFANCSNLMNVTFEDGYNLNYLSDYLFSNCKSLRGIELPSSIKNIGVGTFSNCGFYYFVIPSRIENIGRMAFKSCEDLKNIYFEENSNLERLSYEVFSHTGIKSISIPSNVSSLSQNAFAYCYNLEKVVIEENSKLRSFPAYVFNECDNLKEIIILEGSQITTIDALAFEGLINLQKIDLSGTKLKSINNYSFRFCKSLNSIILPDSLEYIGRYAFAYCTSLNELTLPSSVSYIGKCAFYKTNNLNVYFNSLMLPDFVEYWDYSINGYYLGVKKVYEKDDYDLAELYDGTISIIKYNGTDKMIDLSNTNLGVITQIGGFAFYKTQVEEIILPDSLNSIENYAFAYSKISSLYIPKNVIQINDYAFSNTPITSIIFDEGSTINKIGAYSFAYCSNLSSISIPNSLSDIGSYAFLKSGISSISFNQNSNLIEIKEGTFQNTKLQQIVLPDSINKIAKNAFRNNEELYSVSFGNNITSIESNAFYNSGLKQIFIPESISYIGEYAFAGLRNVNDFVVDEDNAFYKSVDGVLFSKNLKKLIAFPANKTGVYKIPNSVEVIGIGAFENSKLTSVFFDPNTKISTIGPRAFFNSTLLKNIVIPSSVISIDYYAFAMCNNLEQVIFEENCKITGIYEGAFYGCLNLNKISIPNTVYIISDYAFSGCYALNNVRFSENIKLIDDYAFYNSGLLSLELPNTLIEIGDYAFKNTKITNLIVPDSVTIIGYGAFEGCNKITDIQLPFIGNMLDEDINSHFGYIFGAFNPFENNMFVPNTIKNVIITSANRIGDRSFFNCYNISSFTFNSNLKSIGYDAFSNCQLLDSIYYNGEISDWLNIEINSMYNETGGLSPMTSANNFYILGEDGNYHVVTDVIIPDGIEIIDWYKFCNFKDLKTITIPKSVNTINGYAFKNCVNLTDVYYEGTIDDWCNINIVHSYSNIMDYAENFYLLDENNKYYKVTEIVVSNSISNWYDQLYGFDCIESIIIEEGITEIGWYAFKNCSNLKNITLPLSLKKISDEAFAGCTNLTNVYYNGSLDEWFQIEFEFNSNSYERFQSSNPMYYAKNIYTKNEYNQYNIINEIVIPEDVTTIENYKYYNFGCLETLVLHENITFIGDFAFAGCDNLKNVYIPDSLQSIDFSVFLGCNNVDTLYVSANEISNFKSFKDLKELVITSGDKLDSILDYNSLETITLSDTINTITEDAFINCVNLKNVYFDGTIEQWFNIVFENEKSNPMYYASNIYFRNEDNSYYILNELIVPNNISFINDYQFYGFDSIINVVIPNSVKKIGYSVFEECNNITTITLPFLGSTPEINNSTWPESSESLAHLFGGSDPESLKNVILTEGTIIGRYSFYNCDNVNNIILPDSIKIIEQYAFYNCVSLSEIYLPNSIEIINEYAFQNCINLKELAIPDNVLYIGHSILDGCVNLEYLSLPYLGSTLDKNDESFSYVFGNLNISSNKDFIPENLKVVKLSKENSIPSRSFMGCEFITDLYLPNTLKTVGYDAFDGCTNLTNVFYAGSIENWCTIDFSNEIFDKSNPMNYANHFYILDQNNEYTEIKDLIIPKEVKNIKGSSFKGANFNTVYIPNTVESIDILSFESCTDIIFICETESQPDNWTNNWNHNNKVYYGADISKIFTINNFIYYLNYQDYTATLAIYNGYESNIEIDGNINVNGINFKVTKIDDYAFSNNYNLTSLIMDNNITTIGYQSFTSCVKLEEVVLSSNLISIPDYAFYKCSSLSEIIIPNSVMSIGANAFAQCSNLKNIKLSNKLTYLDRGSFISCINLTEIEIPRSIESIDENAFANCTSLVNIYYTGSIEDWCKIEFGNENANPLNEGEHFYMIDGEKFVEIFDIEIPDSINVVSNYQFYGFNNLRSVTLNENINSINQQSFYNCINLSTVYNLSKLHLSLGNTNYGYITYYASNIYQTKNEDLVDNSGFIIVQEDDSEGLILKDYLGNSSSIIIPDNVSIIDQNAFDNCNFIESIELSKNITNINYDAFINCENLVNVYYKGTLEDWCHINFEYYTSNPMCSAKHIFMLDDEGNYYEVKSITIPNTINVINSNQFFGFDYLENVVFHDNVLNIYDNVFAECTNLCSITFSERLNYIGSEAFKNCTSLKEIILPKYIKSIETGMFENCSSLSTVIFNENIKEIQHNAFKNCINLEKIILPNTVNIISSFAFKGCINLKSVTLPNNISILDIGVFEDCINLESIFIPDSVIYIDNQSFKNCSSLENITLSKNIETIGSHAFSGCSSLESIVIPDSVKEIGSYAFSNCIKLKNVSLPQNLLTVSHKMFENCNMLSEIVIPTNVQKIEEGVFVGCSSLSTLTIPFIGFDVNNLKDLKYLFNITGTYDNYIPVSLNEVNISSGTNIAPYTFSNCNSLEVVTLGDSITSIGDSAFINCNNLIKIVIGKNVEYIGNNAFGLCYSLAEIINKSSLNIEYGSDAFGRIAYYAYNIANNEESSLLRKDENGFIYLEKSDINETVLIKYIGFEKEIIIPNNISVIGKYAFYNNNNITKVYIPNTIKEIDDYAFASCENLSFVEITDGIKRVGIGSFSNCISLVEFSLPNSLLIIESHILEGCYNISSLQLPFIGYEKIDNTKRLGYIFGGFSNDSVPESLKYINVTNQSFVPDYAFYSLSNLSSIIFDNQIISIGASSFYNCTSLINYIIPNTVVTIGNEAFKNCSGLTNIIIPESVENINEKAFENCTGIENIIFPANLKYIGYGIVQGCNNLYSITLPYIGDRYDGTSYTHFGYIFGSYDYWYSYKFIPSSLKEVIVTNTDNIHSNAFYQCNSVTNFILPSNLKVISNNAFSECSSLEEIIIPNSVNQIGSYAFSSCSSLKSIALPQCLQEISPGLFYKCEKLENITLPENLLYIKEYAFFDCVSLIDIVIPTNVIEIGEYAFKNCKTLTNFEVNSDSIKLSKGILKDCINLTSIKISFLEFTLGDLFGSESYNSYEKYSAVPESLKKVEILGGSKIYEYTFYNCKNIKEIILSDQIINIESHAFYNCEGLTQIILPKNLSSIGWYAFSNCINLNKLTITGNLTYISSNCLANCAENFSLYLPSNLPLLNFESLARYCNISAIYYTGNLNQWFGNQFESFINNPMLYFSEFYLLNDSNEFYQLEHLYVPKNITRIGKYQFVGLKSLNHVTIPEHVLIIEDCAFNQCINLKSLIFESQNTLFDNNSFSANTHLETLVIDGDVFNKLNKIGTSSLKTVVLGENSYINDIDEIIYNPFRDLTNARIFINIEKNVLDWNELYPDWNCDNKIFYKGEWINAVFYDYDNDEIANDFYSISEVIKQPLLNNFESDGYTYEFIGWDTDDDDKINFFPASSNINIVARAIFTKKETIYRVNYYDNYNNIIETQYYKKGELLNLIDAPELKGYVFEGWVKYENNIEVNSNLDIYSKWSHIEGNHIFDELHVNPTCQTKGYIEHKCILCDYVYRTNFVDEKGHSYENESILIYPTCTTVGKKVLTCTHCNSNEIIELDVLEHNFTETILVYPTCLNTGIKEFKCVDCNFTITETINPIEHQYTQKFIHRSVFEIIFALFKNLYYGFHGDNAYYYECVICNRLKLNPENNHYSVSSLSNCSHDSLKNTIVIEPTCGQLGYETINCITCNKILSIVELGGFDNHNYNTIKYLPTCDKDGYDYHICLVCNHSYSDNFIKAKGHEIINHEPKEPTCTEHGWREYDTCTRCEYSTYEEIKALGHLYKEEITQPTCTEQGYTTHTCLRCADTYVDSYIPALGHLYKEEVSNNDGTHTKICEHDNSHKVTTLCNFGEWEIVIESGPFTEGLEKRTCADCLYEESRITASTHEHNYSSQWTIDIEPTCTTNGSKSHHCIKDNCSSKSEITVIPALGHLYGKETYEWNETNTSVTASRTCSHDSKHIETETVVTTYKVVTPSTCTKEGLGRYTTNVFVNKAFRVQTKDVEIKALGHEIINHEPKEPTCTEHGWREYDTCTRCEYSTYEEIKALGHLYKEEITQPTCTEHGYTTHTCLRCNNEYVDNYVESLNHNQSDWIVDIEPTNRTEGYRHIECTICGAILNEQSISKTNGCSRSHFSEFICLTNCVSLVIFIFRKKER